DSDLTSNPWGNNRFGYFSRCNNVWKILSLSRTHLSKFPFKIPKNIFQEILIERPSSSNDCRHHLQMTVFPFKIPKNIFQEILIESFRLKFRKTFSKKFQLKGSSQVNYIKTTNTDIKFIMMNHFLTQTI
ncbi:hypothetical protein KSF78_0009650, partial [Schistosoma japonicum]